MRIPKSWRTPAPPSPAALAVASAVGLPREIASVLDRLGLANTAAVQAFLDPGAYSPAPASALPDLPEASELLWRAVSCQDTILVWGDFDVDGQTATALLIEVLRALGGVVRVYIPNRLTESHGVRLDALRRELDAGPVSLLLTCDTGVSAHEAIDYANLRGIPTIVTDHHDLPPALPNAAAVINPKRLPPAHPLCELPGVGVAFKLAEHLAGQSDRPVETASLHDLVALGIVADVAQQTGDTRYLLQRGLSALRETNRPGLQALMQIAQVAPSHITAETIGFQLAPRLNAVGRLADASLGVELLTTRDPARARLLATQLEGLSQQRRLLTHQIAAAVHELIQRDPSVLDWEVLILAHRSWHRGIVGIVAAQLAQEYLRPVILFCVDENGLAHGSARSVPGIDIGAAIHANSDQLLVYGGHPGAAGLSLHAEAIPVFRRRISETVRRTRTPAAEPDLVIDANLTLDQLTIDFAAQVQRLAPFGPGNPAPVFAIPDLEVTRVATLGRSREHRRLTVNDATGNTRQVLWWDGAAWPLPEGRFDLACNIGINTYLGTPELTITLVSHRPASGAAITLPAPALRMIDHRAASEPLGVVQALRSDHPALTVWAEGLRRDDSPGVPLSRLEPATVLLIFTTPCCPAALRRAVQRVRPEQVHVLAVDPPLRTAQEVYRRILELVKYAIARQAGRAVLVDLAEAVAQPDQVVQTALAACMARGDIAIEYLDNGALVFSPGDGTSAPETAEFFEAFRAGVAETAAYRAHFHRAPLEQLLLALDL